MIGGKLTLRPSRISLCSLRLKKCVDLRVVSWNNSAQTSFAVASDGESAKKLSARNFQYFVGIFCRRRCDSYGQLSNPDEARNQSLKTSKMYFKPLFLSLLFLSNESCNINGTTGASAAPENEIPEPFHAYWYGGEAEVSSYDLQQSRYGEVRAGDAVLVFVTEDFSKSKQVKLDNPDAAPDDKVSVLKLNFLKKFHTGIYDYSVMASVFTPIETQRFPHTLKTTFSSQDWCGQTFMQFNLKGGQYVVTQNSYFEKEGDNTRKLSKMLLEDEILNRIRLNPAALPTGVVDIIPSAAFSRLQHKALKPTKARFSLTKNADNTSILTVEYLHFERTLTVQFESVFPHRILRWEELDGKDNVTKATLKKSIKSAYWQQNGNQFAYLRDSLGLRF